MIINSVAVNNVSNLYANSGVRKAYNPYQEEQPADSVELSAMAKANSKHLADLYSTSGDIRQDKVVEFQNLIAAGDYNPTSLDIATAILNSRY